jgi:thioredoxin 1
MDKLGKIFYYALLICICFSLSSWVGPVPAPAMAEQKVPLPDQINFIENSWGLTVKRAKAEHKYIFVDAYAIWCGPCKLLKSTTFKSKKVADFFNKNFVNLSVDTEKGEGIKLAEKWEVEVYPTLLILDFNGEVVGKKVGYVDAKELLEFGQNLVKNKKK